MVTEWFLWPLSNNPHVDTSEALDIAAPEQG
jgi:hypothetical protein